MLSFCDFIQVYVFTTNHHLKAPDKKGVTRIILLSKNIFCDPSLELSCRDSSNEGSQDTCSLRNQKNYF